MRLDYLRKANGSPDGGNVSDLTNGWYESCHSVAKLRILDHTLEKLEKKVFSSFMDQDNVLKRTTQMRCY